MPSFTFTKAGRELRIDGPDQLRELVHDKLLGLDDEVQPDGAAAPVRVGDLLEAAEHRGSARGEDGEDPWDVWEDDDDAGASELVEQMLSGKHRASEAPAAAPAPEPGDPGKPRSSRYLLGGGGARTDRLGAEEEAAPSREPERTRTAAETGPPPSTPSPGKPRSQPTVGDGEPDELPASFVEYVQQRRDVGQKLEIHDGNEGIVVGERQRPLPWLIPVVVGVLAVVAAASIYGVIRAGALREYPSEAEVRRGQVPDDDTQTTSEASTAAGEDNTPLSPELREIKLREAIPHAVRPFRDLDTLQDALFTDLANSGVRVRALRVQALVLAPAADGRPVRPEQVHIELDLTSEDGPALEEDLLMVGLIFGHYASVAHLTIQDVVLCADIGDEDPLCYRTRGPALAALYDRETPMVQFVPGLESVLPSFSVIPEPDAADTGEGE